MILLDTNVVSELMRLSPNPGVKSWIADRPADSLYFSAIGEAEMRYGLAVMPMGLRAVSALGCGRSAPYTQGRHPHPRMFGRVSGDKTRGTGKRGHFNFGEKGTFLLCVDSRNKVA